MDLQVALVSVGLCVLSAVVVYLISVFGMKEKTYEEAIEEQRKRNQDALLSGSGKSDKPKKEKKYKKAGANANKKSNKETNSGKNSHSEDSEGNKGTNEPATPKTEKPIDHHGDRVDFKPEAEIIPLEVAPIEVNPAKPVKTSKKKAKAPLAPKSILINKQETIPVNTNAKSSPVSPEEDDAEDLASDDLPVPAFVPKDEVERRHSMDFISAKKNVPLVGSSPPMAEATPKVVDAKKKEEKKERENSPIRSTPQPAAPKVVKDEPVVNSSPNKKNKKGKSDDNAPSANNENEISGKKLLQMVKSSQLQDDEIHLMIEVLLNKQQHEGSTEWTKKNDPVAALKKQLQEREQALENEQRQYQAVNAKLREVRLELGQEKTRSSASERVLKEKLAQQIQETQALHARLQHAHEQHLAETGALQNKYQQLQAKVNDEQSVALQHLSEENGKLQQKLSRLEAERQSQSNSEKQLQLQTKQLQSACEHYEAAQVTHQQKIETYENHLKQLQTGKQEDEYKFAQTMGEMSQKVADAENHLNAVNTELQHAKAVASAAESDRLNLVSRLEQAEAASRQLEDEISMLKKALDNEKAASHEVRLRLEHAQSQAMSVAAQQAEANKISAALRDENERLNAELAQITARTAAVEETIISSQQNGELQASEKQLPDLSRVLEEKDRELSKIGEELSQKLSNIESLQADLDEQKKKNNELREKNWKAMEALNEAEKAKTAALSKTQALQDLERRLEDAQGKIKEAQKVKDNLYQTVKNERLKDREILQRLLPDAKIDNKMDHSIWMENFVNEVSRKISSAGPTLPLSPPETPSDVTEKVINGETGGVDPKLIHLKAENSSLQAQINHYKTVLAETEDILKQLQSGVEAEEAKWREKLNEKERQLTKALEEKAKLEKNLEELQCVEEATAEMQSKLKELQAKLQEEENEKKSLELKADEVTKKADELRQQLDEKTKELEALAKERQALEVVKQELDNLRSQLEQERKNSKELCSQTIKLNSLVKIGQDALRAEQELVKELQAEINLQKQNGNGTSAMITEVPESQKPQNGQQLMNNSAYEPDSSCVSTAAPSSASTTSSTTPISTSNPVKSEKSSKHKKRGASGKK